MYNLSYGICCSNLYIDSLFGFPLLATWVQLSGMWGAIRNPLEGTMLDVYLRFSHACLSGFIIGTWSHIYNKHIDGLEQDCSNSSALAMELLQSCTKPPILYVRKNVSMSKTLKYCHKHTHIVNFSYILTHWGRVMHICISELNIIGSDNGLALTRHFWTNAGILLIWPLGTDFSEMLIKIHIFFIQANAWEIVICEVRAICLSLDVLKELMNSSFALCGMGKKIKFLW